ncbi:MAG: lactate racemase domain-containing protein [Candidatus Heimdallarchaeaceae archaeon]
MEYLDTPISWGEEYINYFIPTEYKEQTKFLHPPDFSKKKQYEGTIEEALEKVLENPIGYDVSFSELLKSKYQPGNPVVIVIDDYTRPNIHTKIVLPPFLKIIISLGIPKEDIRILIATGTHRMPKDSEYVKMVGKEVYEEYKDIIISHDCEKNFTMVGESKAGTPMGFDSLVFESSILITITDTELHYFAGVAGTIKEICPGIAARVTVNRNHPKMFDRELGFVPGCRLGNADETNPVISDIKDMVLKLKEKVTIFGIDTIVTEGEIVYINAGDLVELHEEAKKQIVPMRTVEVPKPGDLVIVGVQSWGINLYQTGKGIHAAWNAVRKDGKGEILVVAPCPDGVGNANYAKTMEESKDMSLQEALEYVLDNYCSEETFRIGNQKPVDLLRIVKTVGEGNLKIITDMPEEEVKIYRMVPLKKPSEEPLDVLRKEVKDYMEKNPEASIYIMDDPGLYVVY